MSHKRSASTTERNKTNWIKNLVRFQESHTKRRVVPLEEQSLENNSRIPLKIKIVGRYLFLGASLKGRKERVKEIAKEVTSLWQKKLNFPNLSFQVMQAKLDQVLNTYDECVKRGKYDPLNEVFDITKENGEWLCSEDRRLYHLQIESKGQVGYTTGKAASSKTIHPSKKRKMAMEPTSITAATTITTTTSESETDSEYQESENSEEQSTRTNKKYSKTKTATKLVTSSKLSTSKAATICHQLSQDGIDVETPSQSGIYRATIKEAVKLKEEMKKTLHLENWSLHFDGKRIDDQEYQVLVLKNEQREVKLEALILPNGKADTVVKGITAVLDEYNLWKSIKMIVADTTNVNTGRRNGIVFQLQRMFAQKNLEKPQFIGCQHHILDRVLRVVMDHELGGNNTSPNIEYPFIPELVKNYEQLKMNFKSGEEEISETAGWRDDMKFLFHLTRVFRFFKETGRFPKVKFQKIPNLSNARWNSRAVLAILAFIVLPERRNSLLKICIFISYKWADHWFTDQKYNADDYMMLCSSLQAHEKALNSVKKFWNQEPSRLDIPRTNQCAERAIKCLQDLYDVCKKKEKLQLRFILSNKT